MASAQATAQRVAATSSSIRPVGQKSVTAADQVIQVKQSTEVVQTLLHGSISCLAYLRSLFAESCFDDQFYETSNSHWPYADYAAGQGQPRQNKETGTRMKVLRRGRSNAVDLLLDWLEKGAFDALQRNVLRALQLNVFEDPKHSSSILELYTFTFHYSKSSAGTREVTGMEMTGPQGTKVTVKNAKYAMQMFIRRMITLCGTLPDLPRKRYLNMHLFYTDECRAEYQPPGFDESRDDAIFFPNAEWKKVTADCGGMDAGFHTISLKVSHLHFTPPEQSASANPALPNNLIYDECANREDDIDSPARLIYTRASPVRNTSGFSQDPLSKDSSDEGTAPTNDGSRPMIPEQNSSGLPSWVSRESSKQSPAILPDLQQAPGHAIVQGISQQSEGMASLAIKEAGVQVPGSTDNGVTTLHSDDLRIKQRLQQMLEPPTEVGDAGDTQLQSQSLDDAGSNLSNYTSVVQLSQSKIQELESMRSDLLPPRTHPASTLRQTLSAEVMGSRETIDCQCGWNEEEDDMISCGFCNSWQHLCCYGFRGCQDPRIPTIHACYRCLLQEKERSLFRELRNLCLLRRGVKILEEHGYFNDKDLSTKLHCDLQTASRLASHLRKEGYLVPAPGSKKKDFRLTGKPRFIISKTEEVVSRMMKQYFDPLAKIAHHFEVPFSKEPTTPTACGISGGRKQGTQTGTSGMAKDGRQESRYALRPRTPGSVAAEKSDARGEAGATPLGGKKRARGEEQGAESWTPRAKRRMRSSVTRALINVEEFMTPSPHNGVATL